MPPSRLAGATVDLLAELAKRTRPEQKAQLDAFTERCKQYAAKVASLEAAAAKPAIDWDYYKQHVDPSKCDNMVERFQCEYESLDVPRPPDTQTADLDAQLEAAKVEICRFKEASDARIQVLCADIEAMRAQVPFDQMTLEDYCDTFPEHAPDFLNKPTFWPHTREEQPPAAPCGHQTVLLPASQAYLVQRWCGLRAQLSQQLDSDVPHSGHHSRPKAELTMKPGCV